MSDTQKEVINALSLEPHRTVLTLLFEASGSFGTIDENGHYYDQEIYDDGTIDTIGFHRLSKPLGLAVSDFLSEAGFTPHVPTDDTCSDVLIFGKENATRLLHFLNIEVDTDDSTS